MVIAGGVATRLHPITKTIPKSMVEINGRPFFEHQIELFKKNGIEEIVMCVGHFAEQIIDYFGDGKDFNISIVYSQEKEKLDTGGAIKLALPYLDTNFFVIYGDSYLREPYQPVAEAYLKSQKMGLMCIYRNDNQIEPSRILSDGKFIEQYRKDPPPPNAHYSEYGLNIFNRSIIDQVAGEKFPISDYFDLLCPNQGLVAYEVNDRFYEVGSHEGINDLEDLLRNRYNSGNK